MSLENVVWVFKNSPYRLGARLVHLALADKANDDNDNELWIKQETIAEMAGLGVDQVGRIMRQMVDDGALILLEKGGGRGKRARYRLVLETLTISQGIAPKPRVSPAETPRLPQSPPITNAIRTQEHARRDRDRGPRPRPQPRRGAARVRGSQPRLIDAPTTGDETVERCYAAYPRKRDRPAAERAIRRQLREGARPEELIAATANFAESMRLEGRPLDKVRYPATFYNNGWREYIEGPSTDGVRRPASRKDAGLSLLNEMIRREEAR